MQAVSLQAGPENGHMQPWRCLHPLSLWGTEPDPGPIAMTSTGKNHVCGPITWQGQNKAR